jgi:hypothetical protein
MSESRENPQIKHRRYKKSDFKLKKDPKTGRLVLTGPKFTKEDVDRDFPEDPNDRLATLMRRSVGL